jgi:hypothetical protein
MSADRPRRLPVSTRHAFALAFELAMRRDPLHSVIVPLLLRSPWILALALLPAPRESDRPGLVMLVSSIAVIGDFLALLVVTGMLRFRARSVFNTPHEVLPAPAMECYQRALGRLPWLFVTEVVRNAALLVATFFFVVPAIFLGHRLSFATEAVVLSDPHLSAAFRRSFRLTERRFERWLELIAGSVLLILGITFLVALLSVFVPGPSITAWIAMLWLLVAAVTPVIQYGWTFFYLRLAEIEGPLGQAAPLPGAPQAGPQAPRGAPGLSLVEPLAEPRAESDPTAAP